MIEREYGRVAGLNSKAAVLYFCRLVPQHGEQANQYAFAPLSSMERVHEPRKDYRGSRGGRSADNPQTSAYHEDVFARLDRLRSNARGNNIQDQLERLRGIAALMQQRDQGPMPGEMLKVYGWEVEDAVEKLHCSLLVSRSSKKE